MSGKRGMVNRNKQFLMNKLREMYGDDFDPVVKMSKNAAFLQKMAETDQDTFDMHNEDADAPQVALDVAQHQARSSAKDANAEWDRVAKYTTPQLKSIEVTLDADVGVHGGLPEVDDLVEELVSGDADSHTEEGSPD